MALRASSGLVVAEVRFEAGVPGGMDLGAAMFEGTGGGRIMSDGKTVCARLASGCMPDTAESSLGRGSGPDCIGESSMVDATYFGVGGSARPLLDSHMYWSKRGNVWLRCLCGCIPASALDGRA